jgi:hypothetical protein
MNIGTIQGGTHAGWRRVKPEPQPWVCQCGRANAKHWARCPDCSEPRP